MGKIWAREIKILKNNIRSFERINLWVLYPYLSIQKSFLIQFKAIGREIRYVEYKLRRQQQEKKKKKQNRDAWMNSGNGSGLDSGSAKFGQEVRASEITFNDDSSKFETDRPANKHEEDLQLEVRNFYYHMFTEKCTFPQLSNHGP